MDQDQNSKTQEQETNNEESTFATKHGRATNKPSHCDPSFKGKHCTSAMFAVILMNFVEKSAREGKSTLDKDRLINLVRKFSSVRVTVLGDLILDEYLSGYPSRISREAPVIILKYLNSDFALGGSSNAANNIAALGAQVKLIGTLGDDTNAEIFERLCTQSGIDLIKVTDSSKATTTKTRVISTSNSNPDAGTGIKQQVLRIDREFSQDISDEISTKLEQALELAIKDSDMVLLSDYENGNFTQFL